MKTWIKKRWVLLVLILLGIGAAVGLISRRVSVEEANKTYDIVMDYTSLEEMVEESDLDMDFWLGYFRELGLDKLAIQEESVDSLVKEYQGLIQAKPPADIMGVYGWQQLYPQSVQDILLSSRHETDMLVTIQDPTLAQWVLTAFSQRTDLQLWSYEDQDSNLFLFLTGDGKEITGTSLASLPLGLDPQKQAQAQSHGYTIIPRTVTVEHLNGDTFAEAVLESYAQLNTPYIIGGGPGILGYDNQSTAYERLLNYLEQEQATMGMVENNTQSKNQLNDGLGQLVEQSGYNALRVFSMWDYVQMRYRWYNYDGPQEITNCLYRGAYERNCRLIYLKMILQENPKNPETYDYVVEPEAYKTLLEDFMTRMDQRGFTMETLTAAEQITVPFVAVVLIAIGAVAAAILLLSMVFSLKEKVLWGLMILGAVGAAGVLYVMPNTGRLVLSIGGGIVMPLLSLVALDQAMNRRKSGSLVAQLVCSVLGMVLICLVGGLFAAAPLSDSAYMLEMELYRGVKVMQLIPLAGFVCYLLKKHFGARCSTLLHQDRGVLHQQVEQVLDTPVKVKNVLLTLLGLILLGILAAVGYYYLARTGHSQDVGVADLELELRNLMEQYLVARPRTKEFLIGYPCLCLYVWSRRRNTPEILSAVFGLGAMIGATSIVNTFLHIRTAYLLSLVRVLIGLGLGLILGLLAVIVAELLARLISKRTHHV